MNNPTLPMLDDPENLSEKAARAWERVTEDGTPADAGRVWSNTRNKASEALHTSERYVREHLGTSVLGVFGAGMVVGALLVWTTAHEQRNDTADSIHHFLARLGRKLNLD